ncbi:MAG: mycothiol synthase [Aeromicrobium sp.]|uniref:mycothiol synthase n=1 Tax=Aeromicrobium sp. TaxID=1871063 RepID=UPI003C380184
MTDLTALAALVEASDGVAPFNEATLTADAAGDEPRVMVRSEVGMGVGYGDAPVELAVTPAARCQGHGRRLVQDLLDAGETRFWAHGDLPGAQALAAAIDLSAERTLLVMRRPADPVDAASAPAGVVLRAATRDDVDGVVTVNGRAFASHPEQGAMDRPNFERRASSEWFSWDGLFVAERDGEIVGFHWTKIEDDLGEVYVVGVDPSEQGTGLGTALTARGLQHLVDAGVSAIDLYVEGDNAPALAVYRRLGFVDHARDTLYAR